MRTEGPTGEIAMQRKTFSDEPIRGRAVNLVGDRHPEPWEAQAAAIALAWSIALGQGPAEDVA
jgi:hypothetical protein